MMQQNYFSDMRAHLPPEKGRKRPVHSRSSVARSDRMETQSHTSNTLRNQPFDSKSPS